MDKILLLDIDQTLAGGIITADVPQIKQYRRQNPQNEQGFQTVRNQIRTSKQVHLDFSPLPYAINGIKSLLKHMGLNSAVILFS